MLARLGDDHLVDRIGRAFAADAFDDHIAGAAQMRQTALQGNGRCVAGFAKGGIQNRWPQIGNPLIGILLRCTGHADVITGHHNLGHPGVPAHIRFGQCAMMRGDRQHAVKHDVAI